MAIGSPTRPTRRLRASTTRGPSARAMSCTRRICKGAKTVARGGARLLPVIIIPRREYHPPGERAGPERKGWKQAMEDRKRVEQGKSVSVRVGLGGRRIIQKIK